MMSASVVTHKEITVLLTRHGETVQGISLPECYSPKPRLRFRQGLTLGAWTGQRQTDGEGNTQRYEVAIPPGMVRLIVLLSMYWNYPYPLFWELWTMANNQEPLCVWVKAEDIVFVYFPEA